MERRRLAATPVVVSALGFGAAAIGGLYTGVPQAQAYEAVEASLRGGLTYFDVAPYYGSGLAERRLGEVLAGRCRDDFVVSTKVGRLVRDGRVVRDYSRDGVLRSLDESLGRLRLSRVDVLFIHDPDDHWAQAVTEAYPALARLRASGVVGAIGVGMNQAGMLARFVRETDLDVVLCAGRYTMLDSSAGVELLPLCAARGVSVVIGGVYNSGILADPTPGAARYDYAPAPAPAVRRVRRLDAVCRRYGVPLKAAAIQFPFRHPAVTAVLSGGRSAAEVTENIAMATHPIPAELWKDVRS
jgi:D-threo-aldose 1-dehydrogenase